MIFEYVERSRICVVREDNYNNGLDHFLNMFEAAKKDFPDLLSQDVMVQKYGGTRRKGQYGIEFSVRSEVPVKYNRIWELELTV